MKSTTCSVVLQIGLILSGGFAAAQSAYVPGSVSCPAGQIIRATPQSSSLTGFTLLKFSCIALEATVTLDTSATPPTIKAIPQAPQNCPPAAQTVIVEEFLSGVLDGANQVFTVSRVPLTIQLYRNGLRMKQGTDYSVAGTSIVFFTGGVPRPGDILLADYTTAAKP